MEQRIAALEARIAELEARLELAEAVIAANKTNIAENKANIAANRENIASNKKGLLDLLTNASMGNRGSDVANFLNEAMAGEAAAAEAQARSEQKAEGPSLLERMTDVAEKENAQTTANWLSQARVDMDNK